MTAGVLTADATAVVDAGPAGPAGPAGAAGPEEPAPPYRWPAVLLLHLGPGVLVLAGYLALRPLAQALDLPVSLALTAAVALIGVPVELGFLVRAARRRPAGGLASASLPAGGVASASRPAGGDDFQSRPAGGVAVRSRLASVVAFRRRLPAGRLAALTGSGLAVAGGLYLWLQPLASTLERQVSGWLPRFWFADVATSVPRSALVAALLVSLVVDGLISPAVQQLYFHGHLMPRLPVAAAQAGWLLAPVTSAALIAAQHLWQPQLVVVVFAVQVLLGVLVWRTRCLAVAVLVHSAGNVLAITATLLVLLAG
jgi:hypothetical protein